MRLLVVTYDVTGLDGDEIAALEGEAIVQAEAGDDHPGVPVASGFVSDSAVTS